MGKTKTIPWELRGGQIWISCPHCKTEQVLPENDKRQALGNDGYDIDRFGKVTPEFVCMGMPNGSYCYHTEYLTLKEW